MTDELNLDQFIELQSKGLFTATIEPIKDDTENVKITPWRDIGGCFCQYALKIAKKAIKSVKPTGDVHYCCGKSLKVVEVKFAEGASISLAELFSSIELGMEAHRHNDPFDEGVTLSTNRYDVAPFSGESPYYPYAGFQVEPAIVANLGQMANPGEIYPFAQPVLTSCPPGQSPLGCGGFVSCQPNGSVCCGTTGVVCRPGQVCLTCGGHYSCNARGSTCCGPTGGVCQPGQQCYNCPGAWLCGIRGSSCCNRMLCPPGYSCRATSSGLGCVRG